MNSWENDYLNLVSQVIATGFHSKSRAGDTYSLPGESIKIPLDQGFPLLTTRRMFPVGIIGELAAFVRGAEDLATYERYGCMYWGVNAAAWHKNKDLPRDKWQIGRSYGSLWRSFGGVDQLQTAISRLKYNPDSRRIVVSAWDPSAEACLPSCHILFQLYTRNEELHCMVYMRSVDLCVGLPSDIALYALLVNLIAKDTGLKPMSLTFFFGDTHVYANHVDIFNTEQRNAIPAPSPRLVLSENASTFTFTPSDVSFDSYTPGPVIRYPFNE